MGGISLKAQNILPLTTLTAIQLLAVLLLNHKFVDIDQLTSIQESGGAMLTIGALAGWLSYLLPADLKNALVFLRWKNALPGHRFLQLAESDTRIDAEALRTKVVNYESLISDHKAQNSYWYREFYRPVANQDEVASTHKSYLLYRDAAAVSLLCAMIFILAKLLLSQLMTSIGLSSVWVFVIGVIGFSVAAGNSGRRLVTTAVAISTH